MKASLRRIFALFVARNKEFYRDRGSLVWAFLFPLIVVFGFAFAFETDSKNPYKALILPEESINSGFKNLAFEKIQTLEMIDFIKAESKESAMEKLRRHKVDILLSDRDGEIHYWVNESGPNAYLVEKMIFAALSEPTAVLLRHEVEGKATRYVDWLIAGLLGMNIMFSALYGVGWVIVRYRKNGVLKRLKGTPVRPWEFLLAHVLSRLMIIFVMMLIVFYGADYFIHFQMFGNSFDFFAMLMLGAFSTVCLGLVFAARFQNEEFVNGMLNLVSWPMMFLSGVWFSLEGSSAWVIHLSNIFPLTHAIAGARKVMSDGAHLWDLGPEIGALALMSLLFLGVGAWQFRWQ